MKANTLVLCLLSIFLSVSCSQLKDSPDSPQTLGSITFPTSASGKAQQEFLKGVQVLHDFWYAEARVHFQKAQELDPDFAMAYWGEAMTYDHPLWGHHDQENGIQVLNRLDKRIDEGSVKWTDREKAYIEALRLLFEPGTSIKERRAHYFWEMESVEREYPDDLEAAIFEALASMSIEDFDFEAGGDVIPVASKLEDILEEKPEHPGALHYLIHVCDSDKFAERALPAANAYADIARSPHALHMPSHIYKRLGMWDKVVDSNLDAYETSVEWQQKNNRPLSDRDFHAFSWLFDGYIQLENYGEACNLLNDLDQMMETAKERGEEYGYIASTSKNLTEQYQQEADAPACN